MFGRQLNKWDVTVSCDADGNLFLALIVGEYQNNKNYILYREINDNFEIQELEQTSLSKFLCLLSVPADLKVKIDTLKFAGEEI